MDSTELRMLFVVAMLVLAGIGALLGIGLQTLIDRLETRGRPRAVKPQGDVRPVPRVSAGTETSIDRRAA